MLQIVVEKWEKGVIRKIKNSPFCVPYFLHVPKRCELKCMKGRQNGIFAVLSHKKERRQTKLEN